MPIKEPHEVRVAVQLFECRRFLARTGDGNMMPRGVNSSSNSIQVPLRPELATACKASRRPLSRSSRLHLWAVSLSLLQKRL